MKKFFKYMALVAVAFMTTTAFTACSDDDDDNNSSSTQDPSANIVAWSWTASDTISTTLSAVFDYTTTVTLPDGTTKTFIADKNNEISLLTNVLQASNISYPATITVTTTRKLAEGYTPTDDEKVSGKEMVGLGVYGLDSKGVSIKGEMTSAGRPNLQGLKLKAWAERYPDGTKVGTCTVTINKTATGYEIVKPSYFTEF